MKKITLEELLKHRADDYASQYSYIKSQIDMGRLKPIKASGTNGKRPALCLRYWAAQEKKDYQEQEEELKYRLVPAISSDYYLKHLSVYEKDRPFVLKLNAYLKSKQSLLKEMESINERSFEIWNREKFLSKEQGRRILKCCGLCPDDLHYYETSEPLSYYSHTRTTPQTIVIVENKDTFYSMRSHLLQGNDRILGANIGTVIYGAGKGILRSFQDFESCVEPYMREKDNLLLYFGDLDFEGILIYENLAGLFQRGYKIQPFISAYEKMLDKAEDLTGGTESLPQTKEGQNRKVGTHFFSYFAKEKEEQMHKILDAGQYIPQEIVSKRDF